MTATVEPLGDHAVRLVIASAEEGRARAAALRGSGQVDDAWHTETHVGFTPRPAVDPRALAALTGDRDLRVGHEHALGIVLDGPDLDDVAAAARCSRGEVERLLFDAALTVSFLGFAPGFAYLRGLDPRLHLPRRATPRPRVAVGSLALAGGFAGIYPSATAGGWHLVGRALDPLWLDDGPRLAAGDRVRLVPACAADVAEAAAATLEPPSAAAIVIDDVRGLAFVEDSGRVGRLHQGMPAAGALAPSALARANRAVGNPDGAAGLERYGALRLSATVATVVATDDGQVHDLAPGDILDLPWPAIARAGYVAVAGGLDIPLVLGGRGTHVRAGLGGHHGRPLRRGDRLPIGSGPFDSALASARASLRVTGTLAPPSGSEFGSDPDALITILPGPDLAQLAPDALARLLSTTWRLSHRSDRMGTRLDGATLGPPPDARPPTSAPLIRGAIELPPDGTPIVLGPEHPTTGGYPVIAVVAAADLDAFHLRPLGGPLRFRLQ